MSRANKKILVMILFILCSPFSESAYGELTAIYTCNSEDDFGPTTVFFLDEKIGWMGGYSGKIMRTTDGGETWQTSKVPYPYGNDELFNHMQIVDISFRNAQEGICRVQYPPEIYYESHSLYFTFDGGETWHPEIRIPADVTGIDLYGSWCAVSIVNSGWQLWTGGLSWYFRHFQEELKAMLVNVDVTSVNENTVWVLEIRHSSLQGYTNKSVFVSHNNGSDWQETVLDFGWFQPEHDRLIASGDGSVVWHIGAQSHDESRRSGYYIYDTANPDFDVPLYEKRVENIVPFENGSALFHIDRDDNNSGRDTIQFTTDYGVTLTPVFTVPDVQDVDIRHFRAVSPEIMYFFARLNEGQTFLSLYKYSTDTASTETTSNKPSEHDIILYPPSPNPFNTNTTIKFFIRVRGIVTLSMFSVSGQHMLTLIDDVLMEGGTYNVQFDGANFASGPYLLRLKTEYSTSHEKFLLLK